MHYQKPNPICYGIARAASWLVSVFCFRRKFIRNELRGVKGPCVVIANHQAALDFVNLIGVTRRKMSFVISNSFYSSLPIRGFLDKIGVIPKQQFQTAVRDMKRIKAVTDQGQIVAIYPAGLMCEDGVSTPIPTATYKFLKWLDVDVYVARTSGTYFVMPKWAKGLRPGRTYMDVYRLFTREELREMDLTAVKQRTDEAILFDAYREQEQHRVRYRGGGDIRGLEHVLYRCPHCETEFSVEAVGSNVLRCRECGYALESDACALLQSSCKLSPELRYVSDWSRMIYDSVKSTILSGELTRLQAPVTVHMIDHGKKKFLPVGQGIMTLEREGFTLTGSIHGEQTELFVPIAGIPALPFQPGQYLELQQGKQIYRCAPEDGRLTMKFIHMLKAYFEISRMKDIPATARETAVGAAQNV